MTQAYYVPGSAPVCMAMWHEKWTSRFMEEGTEGGEPGPGPSPSLLSFHGLLLPPSSRLCIQHGVLFSCLGFILSP